MLRIVPRWRSIATALFTVKRPILIGLLFSGYVGIWGLIGYLVPGSNDLDLFFYPAAANANAGNPLSLYNLSFVGAYPNANGPLSYIPLVAAVAALTHLQWQDMLPLRHMVVMLLFAPFSWLLSYEALRFVRPLRGDHMTFGWQMAAWLAIACSPLLFLGVAWFGHVELPLALWLELLSMRSWFSGRTIQAGWLMGLAALSRSTALLTLVPLIILFMWQRQWWYAARFMGAVLLTVIGGLLPFLLTDPAGVVFSLAEFRAALPVRGGSIWVLSWGAPLEAFARSTDMWWILGCIFVGTLAILRLCQVSLSERQVFGLLTLTSACFPLLAKTVWAYYFLDPYIFIVIWSLSASEWSQWQHWLRLAFPVLFLFCSWLSYSSVGLRVNRTELIVKSMTSFALLGIFLLSFGTYLILSAKVQRASPVTGIRRDSNQ